MRKLCHVCDLQRHRLAFPVVLWHIDNEPENRGWQWRILPRIIPSVSQRSAAPRISFSGAFLADGKDFGSSQGLPAFWPDVSPCLHCPPSAGEEKGKYFRLLSLIYVIDAGTSNFQDKWSISGNGHTGNLSANKLSTHRSTPWTVCWSQLWAINSD